MENKDASCKRKFRNKHYISVKTENLNSNAEYNTTLVLNGMIFAVYISMPLILLVHFVSTLFSIQYIVKNGIDRGCTQLPNWGTT